MKAVSIAFAHVGFLLAAGWSGLAAADGGPRTILVVDNSGGNDYTYALPALARGGYGSALSIVYEGKDGAPADGVAKMRDLLVKLWIGRGSAPRVAAPAAAR